jgi:hypothetical protein
MERIDFSAAADRATGALHMDGAHVLTLIVPPCVDRCSAL